jgi:hypothetical protein
VAQPFPLAVVYALKSHASEKQIALGRVTGAYEYRAQEEDANKRHVVPVQLATHRPAALGAQAGFTVLRGQPGMIERAMFEVPKDLGTVSDVKINGETIRFGGQMAKRMTVKLVGVAALGAGHKNTPSPFRTRRRLPHQPVDRFQR